MSNSLTTIQKYYICNQEIIKKRSREHYLQNKLQINNQRLTPELCICGSVICHSGMRRHFKTIRHKEWLNSNVRTIVVPITKN